jgi:hypothetical protein
VPGPAKTTSWRLEPNCHDHDPSGSRRRDRRGERYRRALALQLATRGCGLALADRDEAGLQTLAAEIGRAPSPKVTNYRVDAAEPGEIEAFAQAVTRRIPGSTS